MKLPLINRIKRLIAIRVNRKIPINWIKKNESSWLFRQFNESHIISPFTAYSAKIERLADQTNRLGLQLLWEGYGASRADRTTRMPNEVRTKPEMGDLFTFLVQKRKPNVVVEIGTAFGVSGMYFLAGFEFNKEGKLLTFEPNERWANLANKNLSQISNKYVLVNGTFENTVYEVLSRSQLIDMAFVDGVHAKEVVNSQIEIIVMNSSPNAIIIIDDINFSENMRKCWDELSMDPRFSASVAFGDRVGLLELK